MSLDRSTAGFGQLESRERASSINSRTSSLLIVDSSVLTMSSNWRFCVVPFLLGHQNRTQAVFSPHGFGRLRNVAVQDFAGGVDCVTEGPFGFGQVASTRSMLPLALRPLSAVDQRRPFWPGPIKAHGLTECRVGLGISVLCV